MDYALYESFKGQFFMRIEDATGKSITSLEDWAGLYTDTPRQHHWKRGRSAYSIADFVLAHQGADVLQARIVDALGQPVVLDRGLPEFEQRFDSFGRGRVHDLGIFGRTESGQQLFVGVEAKVDEPFGDMVSTVYRQVKARLEKNVPTNAPARIEQLLAMHFGEPDPTKFDVRYQLLYATAGTLAAQADIHVLYTIVFKTSLYDDVVGASNLRDYLQFMDKAGAAQMDLRDDSVLGHRLQLNGRPLIALHQYVHLEG